MKNKFLSGLSVVAAVMAVMAASCADKAGYKLDVNVDGLTKDQTVYLSVMQGKLPEVIDSALVEGEEGSYVQFSGTVGMPVLARVSVGDKTLKDFFLENSPIVVAGSMEDRNGIGVTGSKEQDLYQEYLDRVAGLTKDEQGYREGLKIRDEFVKGHPGSVAAAYLFYRQMSYSMGYDRLREYAAGFDSTLQAESVYLQLVEKLAQTKENTSPGHRFTDFALPDTAGKEVTLSSVVGRTPTTYVLLDFWASWCPPCRAENPHVVAAYNEYKEQGFTVFGVSLDRPGEGDKWKEAIEKDGLDWTNVSDLKFWNCVPAAMYGVGSIPANVLIGPDGMIVARDLRGEGLTAKLKEVYGE